MRYLTTIFLLTISVSALAQTKVDTAKKAYKANPNRLYDIHLRATTADLTALFSVVAASNIDLSPSLSGAAINSYKTRVTILLDTLAAQYRKQYVADSLKSVLKSQK